ncbi:MAG: macrocin O-methyltransferase [Ignavibacteria bacterium]|nr:macrocin O-methyltransferase [Ignavibacteria bacterium]
MKFPSYKIAREYKFFFGDEYIRHSTIGLALKRILEENIPGAIAEVGVYRGKTSNIFRLLIPERRLFLFDTFEGFPRQDLENDVKRDDRFMDTSTDEVKKNIGDMTNVIIKKGYVPDTFSGLENECFAFVLLDLDLYKPTLQSLEFFYPRLSAGGYIMIHDYNSPESNWACKRAADLFFKNKAEKFIEVSDVSGSIIVRKT